MEEANLTPYNRTATYDAVNRSTHNYQHIDDSYYIQQRPDRVERVVERDFNPGVTQIDSRRSPRHRQGTYVNPQYQADAAVSPNAAIRRSGEGYVSRERLASSSRHMSTAGGAQGHQPMSFGVQHEMGGSGRRSGREVEEQFFREGSAVKEGHVAREERKHTDGGKVTYERTGSPVSYSSNQRLQPGGPVHSTANFAGERVEGRVGERVEGRVEGRAGERAEGRVERTELKRASEAKKRYVEDSEDDDDDSY